MRKDESGIVSPMDLVQSRAVIQEETREDEEAREKHRSDWIEAEYETMGWDKELKPIDVEPIIEV